MTALDDLYQWNLANWSDFQGHLEFVHDYVIDTKATSVIELGVRSGVSTSAFLHALAETGGHLWSVDTDPPPYDTDDYAHWTFLKGNDLSTQVLTLLPARVDIVFIDTNHWYHHTLAELREYGQRADTLLLHDTELERPWKQPAGEVAFPVRTAIQDYCYATGKTFEERAGWHGLGIVR